MRNNSNHVKHQGAGPCSGRTNRIYKPNYERTGVTDLYTDYDEPNRKITAWFDSKTCQECPCREQCPVKIQKKKALLQFS